MISLPSAELAQRAKKVDKIYKVEFRNKEHIKEQNSQSRFDWDSSYEIIVL